MDQERKRSMRKMNRKKHPKSQPRGRREVPGELESGVMRADA